MSLREASLADVLGAFHRLRPDGDDARRAIARLLGFDLLPHAPARVPPPPTAPTPVDAAARAAPAVDPPLAPSASARAGDPVALVPLDDVRDDDPALPAPLARPVARAARPVDPLFAPTWSRAITGRLVSRVAPVGALDLDRLVDAVARRVTLRALPRRRRLVSASEVTVVIDTAEAMAWFRDDAESLAAATRALSRAPVAVTYSEGAPALAAPGDPDDEDASDGAHVAVGPGGRVLALTDLGLASPWAPPDPASLRAWSDLAAALRARGASLVVVTPVAPARIPAPFRRAVPCLHWDRATPPGLAHRLVKALA